LAKLALLTFRVPKYGSGRFPTASLSWGSKPPTILDLPF
jgi:hypothetical protein